MVAIFMGLLAHIYCMHNWMPLGLIARKWYVDDVKSENVTVEIFR